MSAHAERTARVVALTSAGGAVACGICCVLPFALPAVVLAGTGSALAWIASGHTWMTTVALGATATGWLWVWRQTATRQKKPAPSTLYSMTIATALALVALIWPRVEPLIIEALKRPG